MLWKNKRLERFLDLARVREAIEAAERRTSGEVRVSVAPFFWGSVESAAERTFTRLGMTGTRARNGVLFFIVPSRRAFVVRGDRGIHERVAPTFWDDLVACMMPYFRRRDFTNGVVLGIGAVAQELARHFPYDAATDVDELPNAIDVVGKSRT